MEKYMINYIDDNDYLGIITILDYEVRVNYYLSQIAISPNYHGKKIVVDLALKSGINKYRFVVFDVDDLGHIVLGSNKYLQASDLLETEANHFLREKGTIVKNSFLTQKQKDAILS